MKSLVDNTVTLDYENELPWKGRIQNFICQEESKGYYLKTREESLQDLQQNYQQEESDQDEILQKIFMDDDEALDEE